jgi:hypothetical protein
MYLEFNFRRGLFDAKVPNSKNVFYPLWSSMIGVPPLMPQGDFRSKKGIK